MTDDFVGWCSICRKDTFQTASEPIVFESEPIVFEYPPIKKEVTYWTCSKCKRTTYKRSKLLEEGD